MAQRYIYLTEELNQKLKQEENASALISNLLNEYYLNLEKPEIDISAKRKEIEDLNSRIIEQEKIIETTIQTKAIEEQTAKEKLEIQVKRDEASAKLRKEIEEEIEKQNKEIDNETLQEM